MFQRNIKPYVIHILLSFQLFIFKYSVTNTFFAIWTLLFIYWLFPNFSLIFIFENNVFINWIIILFNIYIICLSIFSVRIGKTASESLAIYLIWNILWLATLFQDSAHWPFVSRKGCLINVLARIPNNLVIHIHLQLLF